ncbi:AMP-binding protein [Kocuria marina]|uniref:AMP-binding protein n=1 Tax=Kocuria marina TaxID=223184 RepID=UPI0021B642EE|nr:MULTISPECIES: AMP-binding protein [Kocuria]MCT2020865.1 AMP-binding protein [Kocuria marina]
MVRPDSVAVVFEGRSVTYREFEVRVRKLANALRASSVRHGDRVAYMAVQPPPPCWRRSSPRDRSGRPQSW